MKVNVIDVMPKFLLEMSEQLNSQDDRFTSEPIFEIRCKRYLVTEEGYSESHWELHHSEGDGWPAYSSKNGYNNSDSISCFYDENESWCEDLIRENLWDDEDKPARDSFLENFCFEEHKKGYESWPEHYYVVHLQEVEETVKSCLTEDDAKAFIARKQHDYPKLYIYVSSMVFCPQMIELRQWIMGLTK